MNLQEIQAELGRQDEALATAMKTLESFGDVQFQIPAEALRELEDACTVHTSTCSLTPYLNGVRA